MILADGSLAGTPDGIRVYPVEGGYVVADEAGWIDGRFLTVEAAIAASTGEDPEVAPKPRDG